MLRKLLKVCLVVCGFLAVALGGAFLRAKWVLERSYEHVPLPPIAANTSPQGVARGEMLFQSLCIECHGGPDGRATGKQLSEIPGFLGKFYSANLAHPTHGVRMRSDGQIARVLRNGILPNGKLSVFMNGFNHLGDADIAALIGYMRSGTPVFEPAGSDQPASEGSIAGMLIVTYVAGVRVDAPKSGVPVPPKAASVDYGRYMAQALDCVGCHTEGFSSEKMKDPKAFSGGFELTDPTGATIYSRNITFDPETGIGRWSLEDFERAVTRGVRPDGYMVRKPMPLFSRLDHTDVAALYAFLGSRPKVQRANLPGGHPLKQAQPDDAPQTLFVNLGCVACHGERGAHRDKLNAALNKADDEIATWILDPQAQKPGSAMPSFRGVIDRAQAEKLARYVKELVKQRG